MQSKSNSGEGSKPSAQAKAQTTAFNEFVPFTPPYLSLQKGFTEAASNRRAALLPCSPSADAFTPQTFLPPYASKEDDNSPNEKLATPLVSEPKSRKSGPQLKSSFSEDSMKLVLLPSF